MGWMAITRGLPIIGDKKGNVKERYGLHGHRLPDGKGALQLLINRYG